MDEFVKDLAKDIAKKMGEETVSMLEDGLPSDVKIFVSTGSTLLDFIISNRPNGGVPVGKITEITGLEATGKSLIAMQLCANTQKMGGLAVYIDTENALSDEFAKRVGLDVKNNFLYLTPCSVEKVFDAMYMIFHKLDQMEKKADMKYPFVTIIWDSVASTPTDKDVDEENTSATSDVGVKPRVISKNITTLIRRTGRKNVAQVFLNQLRHKIGAGRYEDPYITPGGKSIAYAASARVRLTNAGKVKVEEEVVGINVRARVEKTRFGPPYRSCEFPLYFTNGVDDAESIFERMCKEGWIKSRNAGVKGKVAQLEKGGTEYNKKEFKQLYKSDPEFKAKIVQILAEQVPKQLDNPEDHDIEISEERE